MTFQVGDILELKGKTLKGKNRIREHGEFWEVKRLATFKGSFLIPPGSLLIEPFPDATDTRWIAPTNDTDFEAKVHDRN